MQKSFSLAMEKIQHSFLYTANVLSAESTHSFLYAASQIVIIINFAQNDSLITQPYKQVKICITGDLHETFL